MKKLYTHYGNHSLFTHGGHFCQIIFWLGATSLRTFAFDVGERNSKIGVIVWDNLHTNVGTRIWHRPRRYRRGE